MAKTSSNNKQKLQYNFDRQVYSEFDKWYEQRADKALMVVGARQIGKSFAIEQFAAKRFKRVVTINL